MTQSDPGGAERQAWSRPNEYLAVRIAGELVRIAAGPILEIMDWLDAAPIRLGV
jgi:hypothetical protein